jgi:D-threo-aldose 1-dehydrogenase
MAEAYPVLADLRADGVVGAIGVGINQWQMAEDFERTGDFDCFLLAGRYTLLEQGSLASFLPLCVENGTSVIIGGPYSSGILATGAIEGARYNYARAREPVIGRVREIEAVCARHEVPLPSVALQFPLAHPAVVSVIPGARSAAEVEANVQHLRAPIPAALWDELRETGLIDPRAPVPAAVAM